MKIFSAAQLREWDRYTIAKEDIESSELMERAAGACSEWIIKKVGVDFWPSQPHAEGSPEQSIRTDSKAPSFKLFCGKGNNGGDGLAIARMLFLKGYYVNVYIVETGNTATKDFTTNLNRLLSLTTNVSIIKTAEHFPELESGDVIIDALFGTGLSKSLTGIAVTLIDFISKKCNHVIAIDIPSGMYADRCSKDNVIMKAHDTLTFQLPKLCFLFSENEKYFGKVTRLPVGLAPSYYYATKARFEQVEKEEIKNIYHSRSAFSHKGNFGHAAIVAGSAGMIGAAVLSTKGCLRSGAGKVTCITCERGYTILQTSAPEAMTMISGKKHINLIENLENYSALGIGPGLGNHPSLRNTLAYIFDQFKRPLVIDADALNVLAGNKKLFDAIPPGTIITPHPGEFDRLFGRPENEMDRMEKAIRYAQKHKIFIVLKGHNSFIATPYEKHYFNSTGNAGMATGGSGDVLTGVLTGLLAQGYIAEYACILGVYLHGKSGDIAADNFSQEAMIAGDIIECLGEAFKTIL